MSIDPETIQEQLNVAIKNDNEIMSIIDKMMSFFDSSNTNTKRASKTTDVKPKDLSDFGLEKL